MIESNGIQFRILYRCGETLCMESRHDGNVKRFHIIPSDSRLGTWTIVYRDEKNHIQKSYSDYAQGHMIHVFLQGWIHEQVKQNRIEEVASFDPEIERQPEIMGHIATYERNMNLHIIHDEIKKILGSFKKCGLLHEIEIHQEVVEINRFMKFFYQTELPPQMIGSYSLLRQLPTNVVMEIDMNVFRQPLNPIYKGFVPEVILDYCTYTIRYRRNDTHVEMKRFHIPLALGNGNITPYGTYEYYFTVGDYVCKMMDYRQQLSYSINAVFACSDQYSFIGDRYLSLFPFTDESSVTSNATGMNRFGYREDEIIKTESKKRLSFLTQFMDRLDEPTFQQKIQESQSNDGAATLATEETGFKGLRKTRKRNYKKNKKSRRK